MPPDDPLADPQTMVEVDARLSDGKTSNTQAMELRMRQALQLHLGGWSFEEIGAQLDVVPGTIKRYLVNAVRQEARAIAVDIRDLELVRMAELDRTFWPQAKKGDVHAARVVLDTMQRRAKMLGLDAPKHVKFEAVVRDELRRIAKERGLPFEEVEQELELILASTVETTAVAVP